MNKYCNHRQPVNAIMNKDSCWYSWIRWQHPSSMWLNKCMICVSLVVGGSDGRWYGGNQRFVGDQFQGSLSHHTGIQCPKTAIFMAVRRTRPKLFWSLDNYMERNPCWTILLWISGQILRKKIWVQGPLMWAVFRPGWLRWKVPNCIVCPIPWSPKCLEARVVENPRGDVVL